MGGYVLDSLGQSRFHRNICTWLINYRELYFNRWHPIIFCNLVYRRIIQSIRLSFIIYTISDNSLSDSGMKQNVQSSTLLIINREWFWLNYAFISPKSYTKGTLSKKVILCLIILLGQRACSLHTQLHVVDHV